MPHPDTRYGKDWVLTPRPASRFEFASHRERPHDGTGEFGYLTAWEADLLVARIAAHPLGVVRARPYGALVLEKRGRRLVLDPVVAPKRLTARQDEDLKLVLLGAGRARLVTDPSGEAHIAAGVTRIPPAATAILRRRGWIGQAPGGSTIRVSAAGRIAMAWRWARGSHLGGGVAAGLFVDAALDATENWISGGVDT
ncbi:hypothetical protein ACFW6V_39960, partial [Streptomyces sp. NPDC058734]|uniref:hypothetical protein n=1 Tax=Streptomyces sp. NPDC058734 TaxID=3346615 RepID=UPI00367EAC51